MRAIIWTALFVFFAPALRAQDSTFKWMDEVYVKTTLRPKGPVKITERKGSYSDPRTGRPLGNFRMIFAVDTLSGQLLNIVTLERFAKAKEQVTIYYFNQGLLAQAATGVKRNNATTVDNLFTYTEEDNALDGPQLEQLREHSEKYDLLRTARQYVLAFKKEQTPVRK